MPEDVYKRYWSPIHVQAYGETRYRKALLPTQSMLVLKALLEQARKDGSRDVYATDIEISRSLNLSNSSVGNALTYLRRIGFVTLVDRKSMRSIQLERPLNSLNLDRFTPASQAILRVLYARAAENKDLGGKILISTSELAKEAGLEEATVAKELWKMRSTDLLTDKPRVATKRYRLEVRRGVGPNFYLQQLEPEDGSVRLAPVYDDAAAS